MGSGAKIALVALLILMVVAVAKFVQNGSDEAAQNAAGKKPTGPQLAPVGGASNLVKNPKISSRKETAPLTAGVVQQVPRPTQGAETKPAPRSDDQGQVAQVPLPALPSSSTGTPPGPAVSSSPASGPSVPPRAADSERPAPPKAEPVVAHANPPGSTGGLLNQDLAPKSTSIPLPGPRPSAADPSARPAAGQISPPFSGKTPEAGAALIATAAFPQDYKVESGDSYWRIAEKFYGTGKGKLYKAITVANGNANLVAGKTIKVPAPPIEASKPAPIAQESRTASPAPSNPDGQFEYVVQRGDSLSAIARKFNRKQKEIEKANPSLQYQTLRAGAKIVIPKKSTVNG